MQPTHKGRRRFPSRRNDISRHSNPFRHGKTDIASRAFPAFFLGRCASQHPDVILSGYGADLVKGFSKDCKKIIQSPQYQKLFPGILPEQGSDSVSTWRIRGSTGEVNATGLGGTITGKGGHLIVVDDYCKNRAEAISETYQKRTWESFQNDLMTRCAPVCIFLIVATPWHVKDLRGYIRKAERIDPDFPKFERMCFPAKVADPSTGEWTGRYLFEERFTPAWYRSKYATLGRLSAALLDCEPTHEGGNRFQILNVKKTPLNQFPKIRCIRFWDLASSSKERNKDDPDYTVGGLFGLTKDALGRHILWIYDMVILRAEAPARDERIISTARQDGQRVPVFVEAFGGYKDAYTTLKRILNGVSVVRPSKLPGDKSAKCAPLEPLFDAGNVHVPEGAPWIPQFEKQFGEFPDSDHDDVCDTVAGGYTECLGGMGGGFL
jgi:predicted phage terminase large subunit-like protein